MAAYEVLLLNTAIPQIQAAQSGDTYVVPRDIAFSTVANLANGTNLLPSLTFSSDTNTGIYREGADALGFTAGGGTNQMVLTSTGLGIGTNNPVVKLDTRAAVTGTYNSTTQQIVALFFNAPADLGSGVNSAFITLQTTPDGGAFNPVARVGVVAESYGSNNGAFVVATRDGSGVSEKMRLDSSGNLGLGVTPSAWSGIGKTLQVNIGGSFSADAANAYFAANCYYNGTNWIYQTTTNATRYTMASNSHLWYTAPLGTAGNAISFTQAMTLDASGNLGIEETNPTSRLHVAFTSNSTDAVIRVQQKGSNTAAGFTLSANDNNGAGYNFIQSETTGGTAHWKISGGAATSTMAFSTGGTERARITSGGDLQVSSGGSFQVGGTAARATTAGTNRLDIFNGTAPVGTLTDGISIYSSSGEAYVMDAAGNATLFSPHDAETNEWIFKSKHTPTGKVLKIDVERLLKFVNDHFGLDAVHEFVEK